VIPALGAPLGRLGHNLGLNPYTTDGVPAVGTGRLGSPSSARTWRVAPPNMARRATAVMRWLILRPGPPSQPGTWGIMRACLAGQR